jgi:hypothetical protein
MPTPCAVRHADRVTRHRLVGCLRWRRSTRAGRAAGLIDRKAPGSAPKLGATERQALLQMVERGPIPAVHGVVRWRLIDLAQWVWEEFRISISTQTLIPPLDECDSRGLPLSALA